MAEAGAPPHVDVLIVTALKEEYDAVLRVDTGAWRKSTWKEERDALGLERAFRTFQAAHGGALRVLVTRAPDMGEEAAASTVAPLINTYQPRCLAMCGVCAGRKGVVELGDVVIADLLWNYERGKLERTGAGKGAPRVKRRNISYQLRPDWEQRAPSFQPDRGSPWLTERPRPYSAQMDWLLERLLLEEDPAQHPQRTQLCSDYAHVLDRLRERRWIYSKGPPRLTKRGEQYIRQLRGDHPDGLPEPKPFRVHVGPIATGCKVIKDPEIFETLAETDYKVLGLEMEASAIGALAHRHQLDMLVMKGVMDFADLAKNDNFKPFAARASAECLLAFLREHLPAGTVAPSRKEPPDPQALAEALAKYKQARAEDSNIRQLNLQGLAGIAQGPHRTELDLLDFAVAPSLHDAAEGEGGEEASLRQQLNARDLEPARQKELEERLLRLQHERWAHHGGRKHPVISFAKAIRHHRRFVIIGDPGAGKSVLTRLALLACTEGAAGDQARLLLMGNDQYDREVTQALSSLGELLPVRLSLGGLGQRLAEEQLSLAECIRQELSHQRAPEVLLDSLGELLTAGRLFLILDGLDEVPDRQRKRVADAVAALARDYPDVRLVATSRPNGYHPRIQHFDYTRLAPLHESQQHALVWRLHRLVETHRQGDEQAVEHARRRTHALLHAIKTREEWRELSSNPLLLTLCALTSANEEGLPKHRVILFENFIRTLLVEWRAMELPEAEDPLLKAWSSVASTLVQQEKRQGVMEGYLLRLLDEAL
ncbi:MAG TPA: NACHT domain-containing protein, partial [Archangium sp.]|nr:NACHT domain-containing protein [Archangium sp.]